MRIRKHNQSDDDVEVSMSPLIDCVFLLLIFFLVTAMLKKPNKDINVSLPVSNAAIEIDPTDGTVIGVDAKGRFYFDGVEVTRMEMRSQLHQISQIDPSQSIRLDGDEKAKFIDIAEVLDLCNFYQINNVGVRTYDESYNR